MKKVSLFTILLLSGVGASPAMAALTSADDILSELTIYGAVYGDTVAAGLGVSYRYHGDDVATLTLQHTDGTVYGKSYASGLGTAGDKGIWQNHWETYFPRRALSDGTQLSDGVTVHGISQCTRIGGTFAVPNYDMTDPYTTVTEDGERQCWCKLTHVREGTSAPANLDALGYSVGSSSWVFSRTYGSAASCAADCAYYCAGSVRIYASFRSAVFGGGALGHATPADMCGQNLANGKLYDYQVPRVAKLAAGTYTASIAAADGGKWMLRLRGVADNSVVTGEALTAALASSGLALDDSEISNRDGWIFGNASDANTLTFTIRSGEYIVEIAKQDATGAQNLMLEHGDVANAYVAPTPCIRIAGTKIAAAAFERADAMRARLVNVVDHVVSQTITQAGHIATLQTEKQTRPADDPTDANNAENCPEGKKCLLVTDENKTPHWYEIFDPIHWFLDAFFVKNPNGQYEENVKDFRRWQGNSYFRKTYIDGSASVNVRQWTAATPARRVGGMYQTLSEGDLENAGTWAVEYDGTEAEGINAGVMYGIAKCTSVAGTFANKLPAASEAKFYELPAPVGQAEREGYERENFKQCWCRASAVGVPGDDGDPANGAVYPVGSSSWVFAVAYSSAAACASDCARSCANYVRLNASFRSAVFGGLE